MEPDDYPVIFSAADRTSVHAQGRYLRLVRADLTIVVVAASLGALGALAPDGQRSVFAALTAIALIGGLILKTTMRQRSDDQEWFGGRAVAESVKSSTWRYMMRLAPYEDDQEGDARFLRNLAAIQSARVTLGHALPEMPQAWEEITPRMRQVRALPLLERRAIYLSERLEDQARWYRGKAVANRQAAERWFWASAGAQFAGIAFAVLRISVGLRGLNMVGVFTTLAAALTAWAQVRRTEELRKSYALATDELLTIRGLLGGAETEAELGQLVRDTEAAISREHTLWITKTGQPPAASPED